MLIVRDADMPKNSKPKKLSMHNSETYAIYAMMDHES